jgi:DNA glycosylase AlkZ-like
MTRISERAINRATLARELLLERQDLSVVEAVERLVGMQGQEPKHPYVGLWTRLDGFTADQLSKAVNERRLVRATLMRGTLHLFSAQDYLRFRMTLQPVLAGAMSVLAERSEGVEPDEVVEAARTMMGDGPMTFTAIRAALSERFPGLNERALGYTTRMLVPLVMVPDGSRWGYPANAPFTLSDDWLRKRPAKNAVPEKLALRYLAAFGPATPADFQTWSGLQKAKPLFEKLRDDLVVLKDANGKDLYDVPDAPRPDEGTEAPVRYLPEFDNLLLSHTNRTRIIADEHKPAVFTKNLRVKATYLVDGQVAGLWGTEVKRGAATLRLTPFGRLTKKVRAELEAEGTRLLEFLEPAAKSCAFDIE